jgi:hypothetical protein
LFVGINIRDSSSVSNIFISNKYLRIVISLFRADAQKMEEWARSQNGNLLVEFSSRDGEIESILKDISERAQGKGNFSYSRFFAVGLFRLLELSNATEPTVLDKVVLAIIYFVYTFRTCCCFCFHVPVPAYFLILS